MKDTKKEKPTDAMKGYDPTDRDFQRTEQDIDQVSNSEKEALEEKTRKANTAPSKEKIN